uniref:Protein-tyrosine-phosphatase n=1 Tax=Haptolina brevifila TaxID=156173 RepID=A0A7S2E2U7_9EUKA
MAAPLIARENSMEAVVARSSPVALSCSPVARGSPRVARSSSRGPSLLQRVLSRATSFEQPLSSQMRARSEASSPACGETSRRPLQPLAPPPMLSAPSFGSDSDDDFQPPSTFKRQKVGPPGFFSPLGQHCATRHPGSALKPPPIHTMTSLEGPDLADAVPALIIRVPSSDGAPSCDGAPSLVSPTPVLGARGGGFRGSRLAAPPMSLVAPSLYIGDEASAASELRLRQQGITHVLNCTAKHNPVLEAAVGGESAPRYLRLNLLDSTSDLPRMQSVMREGVDFIRSAMQERGTVLVHCHRGISRSCTLVVAYLIEAEQRSAESVFEGIRSKRRIVDPNLGYWCALQEWEKNVLKKHVLPPQLHRQRSASRLSRDSPQLFPHTPRPLSRAG